MGLHHSPRIVTDGLRHSTDVDNIKSYTGGTIMTDLITGQSGTNSIPNDVASWMNAGVDFITITMAVTKETIYTGYSMGIFTKYAGTTDNTFRVYMFGTNSGTAPAADGNILLYSNRGGVWGSVGAVYKMAIPETIIITWQYNTTDGGQTWINGVKNGARTASGIFGSDSNTSNIVIANPSTYPAATLHYTSIYDRELTDSEIVQNYIALRGRFEL